MIASILVDCSIASILIPLTGLDHGRAASVRSNPTDTLALLADLNNGVAASVSYQSRDIEGTQTPIETLNRGWGVLPRLRCTLGRSSPLPGLRGPHRVGISLQSLGRHDRRRHNPRMGRHLCPGLGFNKAFRTWPQETISP